MADRQFDCSTQRLLSCPVCQGAFVKPKTLPCGHTYCLRCLEDYINTLDDQGQTFPCKQCRLVVVLPSGGASEFRDNIFILGLQDAEGSDQTTRMCTICMLEDEQASAIATCLDCSDYLCDQCSDGHTRSRLTRRHKVVKLSDLHSSTANGTDGVLQGQHVPCRVHDAELVRYFCAVCETPICRDCKTFDHQDHACLSFEEAVAGKRELLAKMVSALQNPLMELDLKMIRLKTALSFLQSRKNEAKDILKRETAKLIGKMQEKMEFLFDEIEEKTRSQIEQNKNVLEVEQLRGAALQHHIDYVRLITEKASDIQVLDEYQFLVGTSDTLQNRNTGDEKTGPPPLITLTVPKPNTNVVEGLLRLESSKLLPEPKLLRTIKTPREISSTHGFSLVSCGSDRLYAAVSGELFIFERGFWVEEDESPGRREHGDVYDVSVQGEVIAVSCRGRAPTVIVQNKEAGNRWSIDLGSEAYHYQPAIAMDEKSSVYVVKSGTAEVVVFRSCETRSTPKEENLIEQGILSLPTHIAVSPSGHILVTDFEKEDVFIFDQTGSLSTSLKQTAQCVESIIDDPKSVCVDRSGFIFIACCGNSTVQMFTPDGRYLRELLNHRHGMSHPMALACDDATLIVGDKGGSIRFYQYRCV